MLVDTHCHIYDQYYEDIDIIMDKVKKFNVGLLINNACDYKTSMEVLNLCNKYDSMYCVLGVHPSEEHDDFEKVRELVFANINNSKMIGIGEIGLDYYYGKSNRVEQIDLLKKQLSLAEELDLPVIIHSRESTKDMLDILKNYKLKGILHCFNGSLETAKEYIKMGYKLGINGVITFKNCKLIDVVKNLSLDDIVFETDSPYLTPVPYRGKKNDPSYVNNIVEFLSDNLNIPVEVLISKSFCNVKDIFNI